MSSLFARCSCVIELAFFVILAIALETDESTSYQQGDLLYSIHRQLKFLSYLLFVIGFLSCSTSIRRLLECVCTSRSLPSFHDLVELLNHKSRRRSITVGEYTVIILHHAPPDNSPYGLWDYSEYDGAYEPTPQPPPDNVTNVPQDLNEYAGSYEPTPQPPPPDNAPYGPWDFDVYDGSYEPTLALPQPDNALYGPWDFPHRYAGSYEPTPVPPPYEFAPTERE